MHSGPIQDKSSMRLEKVAGGHDRGEEFAPGRSPVLLCRLPYEGQNPPPGHFGQRGLSRFIDRQAGLDGADEKGDRHRR